MTIMLDSLPLCDGLVWSDEFAWSPVSQSTDYSLTGALIIQESTRQAGRPITLIGQSSGRDHTVWISRANLIVLRTALAVVGAEHTLTLHDARAFTVMAVQDGSGPIDAEPLPAVASFAPANPDSNHWYILSALRLIEI